MCWYRCKVIKTNKQFTTNDQEKDFGETSAGTPGNWVALKLDLEFEGISYKELIKHGLNPGILIQRKVEGELLFY